MTFLFFGLHLILGGKLDVARREDLFFFGLHRYFQWKRVNRKLRTPPLQISGHTPENGALTNFAINIDEHSILYSNSAKYLGVIVDQGLS